MSEKPGAVGPYSSPITLAKLDGRTREGQLLRQHRRELLAHMGGSPSAPQRRLIELAGNLALQIALMDCRFVEAHAVTEREGRQYLAWVNAYRRTLQALGLEQSQRTAAPKSKLSAMIEGS